MTTSHRSGCRRRRCWARCSAGAGASRSPARAAGRARPAPSRRRARPARSRSPIANRRCRSPTCRRAGSRSATRSSCASGRRGHRRGGRPRRGDQLAARDRRRRASTRSSRGRADLECGSTTSNLERQKRVAFSPTIFVSGTKLMVKNGSPIQSFRDLARQDRGRDRRHHQREGACAISRRVQARLDAVAARDHAESFALVGRQGRCLRHRRGAALRPASRRTEQAQDQISCGRRIPLLRPLRHHVPQGRCAARPAW